LVSGYGTGIIITDEKKFSVMLCVEVDAESTADANAIADQLTESLLDITEVKSVYGVDVQLILVHQH
jgi:hypothetical protein